MPWEELNGTFAGVRYHRDGFAVGFTAARETVCGEAAEGSLIPGASYRFFGKWTDHPTYGKQFRFEHFTESEPHDRGAVVAFLLRYVKGCGIGHAKAHALYDAYGGQAIETLRSRPAEAAERCGIPLQGAQLAADQLRGSRQVLDAKIELAGLLDGKGFPKATVETVVAKWSAKAAAIVRRDPFRLLTGRFPGAGFARCDNLYLSLGHDPARIKRQVLAAWHEMANDRDGHTWIDSTAAANAIRAKIGSAEAEPVQALGLGVRSGWLAQRLAGGVSWFSTGRRAANERTIAEQIAALSAAPVAWPTIDSPALSPHQREQLGAALAGPLGILAGTPGTGKTYTAAQIILALDRLGQLGAVAVAAPTGKAAVRCAEAMAEYGLSFRARTIHGLLGPQENGHGDGEWKFMFNERSPLPFRYVVVDEVSMVDTDILAALLRACAPGTHVLLIGDPYQLPPVGHGAPLRDMLAAGVPRGELTEIRRNAGLIVETCASIKEGGGIKRCDRLQGKEDNLLVAETESPARSLLAMQQLFARVAAQGNRDPIEDVQVIVALNEKSELSRAKLNPMLQQLLNPDGRQGKGNPYRVADKIICLSNGDYENGHGYTEQLANGEMGRVVDSTDRHFAARFTDGREIKIAAKGEDARFFALAYAITCHKSQGSQWPVVVVLVDESANRLCSREWVYTAISRARERCIILGRRATLEQQARRRSLVKRKTFLRELIEQTQANRHRQEPGDDALHAGEGGPIVDQVAAAVGHALPLHAAG